MKHSSTLIFFFLLFFSSFVNGQNPSLSKHKFGFYIDDVKDSSTNAEITIIVSGDTIKSNKIGDFYYFPILDSSKNFDLEVKVGSVLFFWQGYDAWMLNQGTRIILGKITKLDKLLSVAKYNKMTKKDEDWKSYSKRFFVIGHSYTLNIENRDKIKEMQFLIIHPNNSNGLVTTQKIVK